MYLPLILGVILLVRVDADYDLDTTEGKKKEDKEGRKDYFNPNPWHPVIGPYEDRLKPIKKDPKDDKFYFQSGIYTNAFAPMPYVTGLYTGPYGYEVAPPFYQPPVYPGSYYNGYIKKDNKEKYTPVYKS